MSVTACILSYNSVVTLPRVIEGVKRQNRKPDRIIVVDNGSEDPTLRYLSQLSSRYETVLLPDNLGVGAGHNTAWRMALQDPSCGYVWTLENDSIPPEYCLERLLATARSLERSKAAFGCVLPKQVHPDVSYEPKRTEPYVQRTMTFNGALIPTAVIRRVGFVREDFFVDQDDREFSLRLRSAGLPIYVDPLAIILHLGKGRNKRSQPTVFRTYYRVRNEVYLRTRIQKVPLGVPNTLIRSTGAIARALLTEDQKWPRVQARFLATIDGLRGNLGKKDYPFLRTNH